jgi:hypothetical protein
MNILILFLLFMFIIEYKHFKNGLQEIIIDLVIILLSPIKLIKYIIWKLSKKLQ